MRNLILGLAAISFFVGASAVDAVGPHITQIPAGQTPAQPEGNGGEPCDILLRYDDGTDDTVNFGPTLGWYSSTDHQNLGVRFTPPDPTKSYLIQSGTFFCDFWVEPGLVEIHAQQFDDISNQTVESVNVTGGGTWGVFFTNPICIPPGKDYLIMLCPTLEGGWGVCGEDQSNPDPRSYWSPDRCDAVNQYTADLMIWSCVTECGVISTDQATWGRIKTEYR
jgi:hypothetical protein